ncbi:MAG TPA: phosphoglycerate kinase [Gammaproteobacteria bacterium]|nr:phosphoglycerate kinase [Gammaproteobacteria bacterium]
MSILKLNEVDIENKRVLIREDLNVPMENGEITSDLRILAALPTIEYCLRKNGHVIVMSHLGRPTEGVFEEKYSLAKVAEHLGHLLGQSVRFQRDWLNTEVKVAAGEVLMLENVRFNTGEKNNDPQLAKKIASLCDVFVMDAFATAHRAEASTCGVAEFAPIACAGPLLVKELEALDQALADPKRPLMAIVGGSKVSSKLSVLESLIDKVDQLIVGGGIANTFIAAAGFNVGQSLYEPDLVPEAQRLMQQAQSRNATIPIPSDVIVAKTFAKDALPILRKVADVAQDERILDIGPETTKLYVQHINAAGSIIWNGPVGVFEWDAFAEGTKATALAIAQSHAFSLAGGGDTIAAIEKYDIADKLSYISTGGGAFLEFLEGKKLPAIAALELAAWRWMKEIGG